MSVLFRCNHFQQTKAFDLFFLNFFLKLFFLEQLKSLITKQPQVCSEKDRCTPSSSRIFKSVFGLKRRLSRLTEHAAPTCYIHIFLFEREQYEDFNDFERENYEDFNDIIDLLIGKIFGFVFSRKMGGTIEVFYASTFSFEHACIDVYMRGVLG